MSVANCAGWISVNGWLLRCAPYPASVNDISLLAKRCGPRGTNWSRPACTAGLLALAGGGQVRMQKEMQIPGHGRVEQ